MTSNASLSSDSRSPFKDLGCWLNILAAILLVAYLATRGGEDFDRDTWLRANPAERAEMAPDLIENHLRPGTSRRDVEAMLGKPSTEHPADPASDLESQPGSAVHTALLYAVGPSAELPDAGALVVELDADGIVLTAAVR